MSAAKTAITPTRADNFAEWYQEVIKAADLAEHSVVRGCMIIKPWGYAIWEAIQRVLDKMIKETGHQNVYFPLLIPLSFLAKEADHVEGFAKECAVVTHYRLETDSNGKLVPAPDAELAEPLIIRPTSETIIGHAMAKWIQSYNDLPIMLNQWCNVMRWEMRTRLFLRTSEFLWQEGHTAHATQAEAETETQTMLDVYERLALEFLAIPVFKGEKTAAERFPGAVKTYTIEAIMQDGKALQAGTSHFLGQNFAIANDIKFTDKNQQSAHAWTTSWGLSTRIIGALIMTHSDDDGLVLPPRIAPEQIILLPVAMNENDLPEIIAYCQGLALELRELRYDDEPLRVAIDKSNRRAGDKFWNAVKKGIPVRIEIGKREIENDSFSVTRRDHPAKQKVLLKRGGLLANMPIVLAEIQTHLMARALSFREAYSHEVTCIAELETLFKTENNAGFAIAYFDSKIETQQEISAQLKALKLTTRCMPFIQNNAPGNCIFSGNSTAEKVIFARAY